MQRPCRRSRPALWVYRNQSMFNDLSEVKMMISESLYGGNNALSLSLGFFQRVLV